MWRQIIRWTGFGSLVALVALGAGWGAGQSQLTAPPAAAQDTSSGPVFSARGPYAVGVRDYVIADAERPLESSVWYPADATLPNESPDAPTITYTAPGVSVEGRALRDAPVDLSGGPYPLVVFSHGAGGFRFQSTYFTEHLASYGFVVIAAEHPGSTLTDPIGADFRGSTEDDFGGQVINDLAENYGLRPLDVLREIAFAQTLTAPGGDLAGLIDTGNVAVTGHSFGGYTALAAGGARLDINALAAWCVEPQHVLFDPTRDPAFRTEPTTLGSAVVNCLLATRQSRIAAARGIDPIPDGLWPPTTDPRIKAMVALAPWNAAIFGPDGLAALDIPTMIQVGTADTTTPPDIDAYVHYTGISSTDKALVVYEDAGHLLFANGGMQIDDRVWDMDAAHALVNHFATAFLRAVFYDDATAEAALAPENVDYEDVRYDRVSAP